MIIFDILTITGRGWGRCLEPSHSAPRGGFGEVRREACHRYTEVGWGLTCRRWVWTVWPLNSNLTRCPNKFWTFKFAEKLLTFKRDVQISLQFNDFWNPKLTELVGTLFKIRRFANSLLLIPNQIRMNRLGNLVEIWRIFTSN